MAEEIVSPAKVEAVPVEESKPAVTPAADTPAAEPVTPKTYTQEDLDRITAKVKKNERYRTRKEIEAYYQGRESAAPRQVEQPQKPAEEKPPTRDQFDSYEAFLDAKAEFTGRRAAREERAKAEAEAKQAQARTESEKRIRSFQEKLQAKYPDIGDRIESIANIPMPDGVSESIAESEFGPDILNHFADNPKDFERLATLSPSAALREIGRLEAKLEASTASTPDHKKPAVAEIKKPSSAPAPLKPVGGTAAVGDGEPSHDNPEAWRRWRDKQVQKRKAGSAK